MEYAGKDATERFESADHTKENIIEMQSYLVGEYDAPRIFRKLEEIAEHNLPNDLWLLIDNKVYDVSNFKHPGKLSLVKLITQIRWKRGFTLKCRNGCNYLI